MLWLIPARRYIIWEEYRLHAISFSLRCTAVFIAGWAGASRFVLFPTVMVWHLIADEITRQCECEPIVLPCAACTVSV